MADDTSTERIYADGVAMVQLLGPQDRHAVVLGPAHDVGGQARRDEEPGADADGLVELGEEVLLPAPAGACGGTARGWELSHSGSSGPAPRRGCLRSG